MIDVLPVSHIPIMLNDQIPILTLHRRTVGVSELYSVVFHILLMVRCGGGLDHELSAYPLAGLWADAPLSTPHTIKDIR